MNNELFMDLHLHSRASDGDLDVRDIIQKAKELKFSAISITDHDSVSAVEEAIKLGNELNIEVIPGVELSAYNEQTEIHILGYFVDFKDKELLKTLESLRKIRKKRIFKIIEKLRELKIEISSEEIFKISGEGAAGRLHVARILLEKGIVKSTKEAFDRFLGNRKSAYIPKEKLTPQEAIQLIREAKGIPVLAHPGILGRDDLIPEFVRRGMMGIEVYHSEHSPEVTNRYIRLAKEYNLLITGGSDCHGNANGRMLMGNVKVPYSLMELLKKTLITLK